MNKNIYKLNKIKEALLITGITLLLILITNIILTQVMNQIDKAYAKNIYNNKLQAYDNAEYYAALTNEFTASNKTEWKAYTHWTRAPFQGQYINIDKNGLRKTWNKTHLIKPFKIFMFGGSTMWGTGSRDNFTIPSLLSKKLKPYNVEITNFGESGYVSSQELILLISELKNNNVPNLVIFYDGVNDIFTSIQNKQAGLPANISTRIQGYKLSLSKDYLYKIAIIEFLKSSGIYRFAIYCKRKMLPIKKNEPFTYSQSLSNNTVNSYIKNIELIETLGEKYNFKTLFYWQPNIFFKKHLTDYEKKQLDLRNNEKKFIINVHNNIEKSLLLSNKSNFHNLTNIFYNYKKPLYLDWCHITEEGNNTIAEDMYKDVIPLLKKQKTNQ